MRNLSWTVSLVMVLVLLPGTPRAACTLGKYADLPVTIAGQRALVNGSINGVDARFIADTGAFFSTLTREAAAKFKLNLRPLPYSIGIRGIGGAEDAYLATAKEFSLAGFRSHPFKGVDFVVAGNEVATEADGLIGQNLIGDNDTEFDLANGAIRMFLLKDCKNHNPAYWSAGLAVADMNLGYTSKAGAKVIGTALLNGAKIRVLFDSGTPQSILTLRAAARAGVKPGDDKVIASHDIGGMGPRRTETWIARFDSLDLGGELIKNGRLLIGDIEIPDADMLLGLDFFLSHRVLVAESQHQVFFTFNGGPVFDLYGANRRRAATNSAADRAPAATDDGSTPPAAVDAAELRRRGAALAARGDYKSAITDFDEAIQIDPANADSYYQRAMTRSQVGQIQLAMADLDQELSIKPDDIPALMQRAFLRLRSDDEKGAGADYDAVTAMAPADASLSLRIAESYANAGHFPEAIARLDQWIAANPRDDRIPTVLGTRCWSRAMNGKDLDLALADCDAALRRGARTSRLLDLRALVRLRLGHYDPAMADYAASLKLQPKSAAALYGLGLAELKKGLQAEGNRDIQAAVAIDPAAAGEFKRIGLVP